MNEHRWLVDLLLSVAAEAERAGLSDVAQKVSEAAIAAMAEVPGADQSEALRQLSVLPSSGEASDLTTNLRSLN